jgi:hypothetical protein
MLVIVPTYRRHSNGEAQTFEHVPKEFPLHLVVREEEAESYNNMLVRLGRSNDVIVKIPEGEVNGIADTRNWTLDWAWLGDERKIVMLDDDLHFIVRGKVPADDPGWDYKLRPCDDSDWLGLMSWFEDTLDTYAHAAVSMREGNNRTPGIGAEVEATRGIRMVGYSVPKLKALGIKFRREVEGREDVDMTLQLLRQGLPNLVTYHWAQGQRSADAPGGLEGTRDAKQLDDTAELLCQLHPGLVRKRMKTNKSGAMAGERTEFTAYWKRALAEGRS